MVGGEVGLLSQEMLWETVFRQADAMAPLVWELQHYYLLKAGMVVLSHYVCMK